jgi:hypothetical protein
VETSRQSGASIHGACNTVAAVNTIVWVDWLIAVRVLTVADFRLNFIVAVAEVFRSVSLRIDVQYPLISFAWLVANVYFAGWCSIRD